jgi:glycosyltransferase involved in cell wall biosynthesis
MSRRLKLAAWASARNLLSAMREQPAFRPAADRVIDWVRQDRASAAVTSCGEPGQERALQDLLAGNEPAEAVARRVVMVCGSLQPGGAERQLVNAARGLASHGVRDITVLCAHLAPHQPEAYDFFYPALRAIGAVVRQIRRPLPLHARLPAKLLRAAPMLPSAFVCDTADLWRELIELRPAVVHAWLDWSNIRAGTAAVLAGIPRIVLSGRNLNPTRFFFHEPVMRAAYRPLLACPGVMLLNNSIAGAEDYADWLEVPRERVDVVYNGTALPKYDPPSALAERRRIGVPDDALLIGSMFRFSPEKRPLLWLDAAAAILARRDDTLFAVYGMGPMLAEIRDRAVALGLQRRLILPGLSADPLAALGAMDLFLLTSKAEGTPNTMIEAQWAGKPVVACAAGGVEETFLPGENGILVPGPDPEAIADAVLEWAVDRDRLERAREIGPAFVASRFSLDRMVEALITHYGFYGPCHPCLRAAAPEG